MINPKRVIIATAFGFISGFLCYLGGRYGLKAEISGVEFFMVLLHRSVLGFVIGISGFRIHWALHGILLGFIIGLPGLPLIYSEGGFLAYSFMSIVWGFIIELLTSVVFKARALNIELH